MRRRLSAGLSVIEVMLVLVILGALIVLIMPRMRAASESNRITRKVELMQGAIQLAQAEARRLGISPTITSGGTATSSPQSPTTGFLYFRVVRRAAGDSKDTVLKQEQIGRADITRIRFTRADGTTVSTRTITGYTAGSFFQVLHSSNPQLAPDAAATQLAAVAFDPNGDVNSNSFPSGATSLRIQVGNKSMSQILEINARGATTITPGGPAITN
ncbi:MAG TPA: type II secretion system protein [Candidatus Nitrosotenuis sp.]|nr:type II secretion system protein [Candidatus Nitrosotenuis sp.]